MIKIGCPKCGAGLILFPSLNSKACSGCYTTFTWDLDEGQKPLFGGKTGNDRVPIPRNKPEDDDD